MSLNKERKIIFIHIPKNAGTSIHNVAVGIFPRGRHHAPGHMKWYSYKNKFPNAWKNYFKFAIVRNPWDRMVSAYEYARMDESFHHGIKKRYGVHQHYHWAKKHSFKDWVNAAYTGKLRGPHHQPQHLWIYDPGKKRIVVDEVVRMEQLDRGLLKVAKKLGVKYNGAPCTNPSIREADYRCYYKDKEVKRKVSEMFKIDIDLFNYTF